jgi:hypothetical protein
MTLDFLVLGCLTELTVTPHRKTTKTGKTVIRDSKDGRFVDVKTPRIVLFPTEASKLGRKTIEHAVDRATSKK